jgi:acyl-CoA synthetase (AMP-forming)/AMP-acid ligase II
MTPPISVSQVRRIAWRASLEARGLRAALRAGMLGVESPRTLAGIVGALRGLIISGGENVFPREVEELLHMHAAISDAAVIGVEDPDFGQRLRAFVVLRDGQSLSAHDLQAFVKENLARYKVPRDVLFLGDLPRNPTGKILKRELAQIGI